MGNRLPQRLLLDPPSLLDERVFPGTSAGVTGYPGLYFLGLHNQYSRGSSLIHWVRHDAEYIASQARACAAAARPGDKSGDDNPGEEPASADHRGWRPGPAAGTSAGRR